MKLFNKFKNKEDAIEATYQEQRQLKLIDKFYAKPVKDLGNLQFPTDESFQQALMGVTTLVFEDQTTGDIITKQVLGTDHDDIEDVMVKVSVYGPQNIKSQITGKVYTLSIYNPPLPMNFNYGQKEEKTYHSQEGLVESPVTR